MDGDYPNIRALFPEQTPIHAVVRTSDLTEAARRISLVAERNTPLRPEVHLRVRLPSMRARGDEAQALRNPAGSPLRRRHHRGVQPSLPAGRSEGVRHRVRAFSLHRCAKPARSGQGRAAG